jgi:hypothetical protein
VNPDLKLAFVTGGFAFVRGHQWLESLLQAAAQLCGAAGN